MNQPSPRPARTHPSTGLPLALTLGVGWWAVGLGAVAMLAHGG